MARSTRSGGGESTSGPHAFVKPPDPRLGLALGAGRSGPAGPQAGSAQIAGFTTASVRCAMPGCGKEHDDPIHWPAG